MSVTPVANSVPQSTQLLSSQWKAMPMRLFSFKLVFHKFKQPWTYLSILVPAVLPSPWSLQQQLLSHLTYKILFYSSMGTDLNFFFFFWVPYHALLAVLFLLHSPSIFMHASAKICNQFIEMAFWYSFLITLGAVTLRKVFLKRITVCLLSRPYLAFNRFQSRTSEFIWTALASLNFLVRWQSFILFLPVMLVHYTFQCLLICQNLVP